MHMSNRLILEVLKVKIESLTGVQKRYILNLLVENNVFIMYNKYGIFVNLLPLKNEVIQLVLSYISSIS